MYVKQCHSPFLMCSSQGERHKLSEANVAAMYHNVKHWTGHGRVAPVSLLHRLLKLYVMAKEQTGVRSTGVLYYTHSPACCTVLYCASSVETEEDLDWAMKALTQCRTRFVTFRTTTSPLLMRACCRAGRIDKAVEILEDDAGYVTFYRALWGPRCIPSHPVLPQPAGGCSPPHLAMVTSPWPLAWRATLR